MIEKFKTFRVLNVLQFWIGWRRSFLCWFCNIN